MSLASSIAGGGGGSGGSGDTVGPASATDNALARFDGTTGKLLQDGLLVSPDAQAVGTPGLALGTDPNTGLYWPAADTVALAAGGVRGLNVNTVASGVNYLDVTPSATTANVVLATAGTDTNIGLSVTCKGTGSLFSTRDGTKSAPSVAVGNATVGAYQANFGWQFASNGTNPLGVHDTDVRVRSSIPLGWSAGNPDTNSSDTGLSRISPGVVGCGTGAAGSFAGTLKLASTITAGGNGGTSTRTFISELLTLNTGATTTATAANLAPANSRLVAIKYRITTTITTAASFTIGVTGGNAFVTCGTSTTTQSVMTAGTTGILVPNLHADGYNTADATVTVTTNANPGAGVIRLTMEYEQLVAATS